MAGVFPHQARIVTRPFHRRKAISSMVPKVLLDCDALAKSGDMMVRTILTAAARAAEALPEGDTCVSIALSDAEDQFIAAYTCTNSDRGEWSWREGALRLSDFLYVKFIGSRHMSIVRVEFTPLVVQ